MASTRTARTTRTATRKPAAVEAPAVEATTAPTAADLAPLGLLARAAARTEADRTAAALAALAALAIDVPADYVAPTGGYNAGAVTPATRDNGFRAAREAHAARLGRRTLGREVLALCWGTTTAVVWRAEAWAEGVELRDALARLAAVTAEQAAAADSQRKAARG